MSEAHAMTDLAALPAGFALASDEVPWTWVAAVDSIPCDRGVAVLVNDVPAALFRLSEVDGVDEEWHAVSHLDPSTGAPVMARGLVGSHHDGTIIRSTVASPLHKQRYDLATGRCLDDDAITLQVFEVMVIDGQVLVR